MRTLLAFLMLVAAGCGVASDHYPASEMATADFADEKSFSRTPALETEAPAGAQGESGAELPEASAVERKIIYTAQVNLVVEEFGPLQEQVEQLVAQFDAYVARSNISGSPGRPRTGTWTVRVPAERYKDFLTAVRDLGEVRSVTSDSKDVTAEFFDVDARIRNKQREEERLLKLLDEATGKLHDILEVERELSRVRGEVEQLQGRLRVLKDLTSLTTIDIRIDEIKDYVPESPEGPTYWTRVRRAFSNSIRELVAAAQAVSIAIVAAAPWLGVALVILLLILLVVKIIRWFWRRS